MEARELSPGELTGSKLADAVRLDKLAYADAFAERYTGRLIDTRRAVFVTVFNQKFQVDAAAQKRVETARAKVGSPMPPQINTLLQTNFAASPPFLVESEPRGPSIRALLNEKRTLPWDQAVRITANLARAMQWLHEHDVPHCSFHPESVFVTRLQSGQVVVNDWALEALFPPDSAERLLEADPGAFAGYVDYMAPEVARSTDNADIRSAVYALGCVLYEMVLGKVPLPGTTPAEVLKRHQHEKPVRLSIAVGGGGLPAELDDILEMMLAKDPDRRFQSPAAAVAALSNLVGEAPDELAPGLQRAAETDVDDLYRTIDMDSVDRDELDRSQERRTLPIGEQTQAQLAEARLAVGGAVSGESRTVDVDATIPDGDLPPTDPFGAAAAAARDATDESVDLEAITKPTRPVQEDHASKKTLLIGSLNAIAATPAEDEDPDDAPKKTLLNFGAAAATPGAGVTKPAKASRKEKKRSGKVGKIPAPGAPRGLDSAPSDETIKIQVDVQDDARQEPAAELGGEASEPAPKPVIALDAATAAQVGLPSGKPTGEILLPDPGRDATRDLDRSNWFTPNAEDVWESSLEREAQEHSARSNRTLTFVIIGVLVAGALGLIAYFEMSGAPDAPPTETPVAATPTQPAIDLGELRVAFDDALAAGRIVEPVGNSALTHLESLKRHAADDPAYEEARASFVKTAHAAALEADKAGDLRAARALAGYASQYAPEDAALAKLTEELQARFVGAAPAADAAAPEAAVDAGAPEDAGAPQAAEAEVAEPPPAVEPAPAPAVAAVPKPKPEPRPAAKPAPKPAAKPAPKPAGESAESLAKDARAAHTSGNLDEARSLYTKALEVDPNHAASLAGLGKVYFDKANYREALKWQTKAVRYAPGRNDYRINLGQSYYRLEKYQEAIGVWEKVLERDPNNSTARQYVELAKRKLGQ